MLKWLVLIAYFVAKKFKWIGAVEENNEIGKEVGTFVAQDGEDDGLKYELINGTNSEDNASFRIDTATNKLIATTDFPVPGPPWTIKTCLLVKLACFANANAFS